MVMSQDDQEEQMGQERGWGRAIPGVLEILHFISGKVRKFQATHSVRIISCFLG